MATMIATPPTLKKKFKIVTKESRYKDFRMFDFRTLDIEKPKEKGIPGQKSFRIQMFGINEKGETCALFVDDFQPFFYVKLPPNWRAQDVDTWFNETKKSCGKYYEKDCLSVHMEKHSKLYEFTADTSYEFAKCVFRNMRAFNQFKKKLQKHMPTYESKIPPLLRYFHIHNISPSGWVQICVNDMTAPPETWTSCTYEYMCSVSDIKPLKDKETPVPYKIASVDIEASSSHGDFPLPIKDYKRMATQVIDVLEKKMILQKLSVDAVNSWLKKSILSVFSIGSCIDGIDVVYAKETPNKEDVKTLTKLILEQTMASDMLNKDSHILKISEMFETIALANANNDEEAIVDSTNFVAKDSDDGAKLYGNHKNKKSQHITPQQKTLTMAEYLTHPDHTREMKIQTFNTAMTNLFPALDGDRVTFIGTTFLKFGQKEPYKNHCLVVGTCDPVDGVEICTVANERECLVDWTQLIQDENPDIIIGYNIFGFDYQFMFQRAKELDCVEEFCALSRVQSEICYKEDYETKEKALDHTQNRLASGDYDLHYPPISGRLQIDLLFYFRRDYNMSSYKLDDVAGTMIRDDVKALRTDGLRTELYSKNLAGLHVSDFIHLEIASFTTDYYAAGKKFRVLDIRRDVVVQEDRDKNGIPNGIYNVIVIEGDHSVLQDATTKQSLKWGMAKDDVSPQDIFRLTKESAASRAIVAKYCVQDCNLVHHLMTKVDVLTGYIEMARICNVPISFLVFRGQGIKLTSYVAKVCREKDTLMPDLEIATNPAENDGYEGAIVLPPKCAMYGENPVACVDYSSLYPSIAKGWNLSPNSKVWTKNYDLNDNLIKINDELVTKKNREALEKAASTYANLPNYEYIEVTFDSFEQLCKEGGREGTKVKTKTGKKVVRWAQFPDGQEGIIPCIIGDLLKARKETRQKAEKEPDPFIANILDKRQLGYKVTANSLYGQMGSSVSTFFEKDVAASITAIGRMMIIYAKHMVEEIYGDSLYTSAKLGNKTVRTRSAYVYGDTDSVFFTFNLEDPDTGAPIRGKEALEWTIEISQEAAALCSMFLPPPMLLAYEKTLMNFILLSKKRYVGILYEYNPNKGKLKFMGLPLKRRDSCDYLKDVYGGILTILMKEPDNVQKAIELLNTYLKDLVKGQVAMDKLALTKSLRSDYKNPKQIAHKVLADRIGEREPGNRPKPGERIKYAFIENKNEKLLGNRIETLEYIKEHKLAIDYHYYITNQLMNPLLQLFSLALEKVYLYKNKRQKDIVALQCHLDKVFEDCDQDLELYMKKREKYCSAEVKQLLFDPFLTEIYNTQNGIQTLFQFYKRSV